MEEEEHEDEELLNESTEDASFLGDQQVGGGEDGRAESDWDKLQELELPPLPAPLTTLTSSQLEEVRGEGGDLLDGYHVVDNGLEGSEGGVQGV